VQRNVEEKRLHFSTSLPDAMVDSSVYFIAVGTPPGEDGSADLQYVLNVAREIGQHISTACVIVDKSTVPVGTADQVKAVVQEQLDQRGIDLEFDVVSNPEFLKEGDAINDFMKPDRIIIGCNSPRSQDIMSQLYAPFNRNHVRTMFMGVRDAELTKYAANAMLATKISFINEVASLCAELGVDVENVRRGIGADSRIGHSFIYPGCGYGGSCFPKDVKALIHMAKQCDIDARVLLGVEERNAAQKQSLYKKIVKRFGSDLSNFTFALWGLAFKPGTDDMREAPSVVLLQHLIAAGARIKAYDPVAMDEARKELPPNWFETGTLELVQHQYEALQDFW